MEIAVKEIGECPIISANGYISRDLFNVLDKKSNFVKKEDAKKEESKSNPKKNTNSIFSKIKSLATKNLKK